MNIACPTLESHLEQALALHRSLPVSAGYFEYYGYDSLFKERGAPQCDLEKLDAAHIRCFGIALANGSAGYFQTSADNMEVAGDQEWAYQRLLGNFATAMANVQRCPRVQVVARAADLTAGGEDTLRVIPLVTGHAWMKDLEAVREMFRRGLRISHAASVSCLHWCSTCPGVKVHGKSGPSLTEFGREVVALMNELGMVLDLAHMSQGSAEAIVEASSKPVMDGHTGSRTLIPEGRGLLDETLRKIADKGGVVGVHFADHLWTRKVWGPKYKPASNAFHPIWVYNQELLAKVSDPEERMHLRKDRAAQQACFAKHNFTPPPPSTERIGTVADMADHIDHLVNVMGEDHVGLGGDVNGISADSWPAGADHVGELPRLSAELLRRGWPERRVANFLSGNWQRLFRACLPA